MKKAILLIFLICIFFTSHGEEKCPHNEWPIAARSLSRNCCDLYPWEWTQKQTSVHLATSTRLASRQRDTVPKLVGGTACGAGERFNVYDECSLGSTDTEYKSALAHLIPVNNKFTSLEPLSIYVGQRDLDHFLSTAFPIIPIPFILVVAQEDSGSPLGLWGIPSRRHIVPVPKITKMNITTFLEDSRLLRLYVQNFDFSVAVCRNYDGSNPKEKRKLPSTSCQSQVNATLAQISPQAQAKIIPIPIGLDLHSLAELTGSKGTGKRTHMITKIPECQQIATLRAIQQYAGPWSQKRPCVSVTFDGGVNFACRRASPPFFICFREWILRWTRDGAKKGNFCIYEHIGSRNSTWNGLASSAFGIAPPGHGTDTHRFWEMLLLNVVPVVISSSLDSLYNQFPCIILDSWHNSLVHTPDVVNLWKKQIVDKWGPDPFTPALMHRLSSNYWADLIHKGEVPASF
uniref:Exostosin GT47 domain-containing protein n=1 Tax=Aureoumbra lagunensis TaxID=44058 RepID=A0A6S8CH60_9STRA